MPETGNPDIRVLVGNAGDAKPDGASARLIRKNIQDAFQSKPAKITIEASTKSLNDLKKTIENMKFSLNLGAAGSKTGKGAKTKPVPTVPIDQYKGATVSVKPLTAQQAELLRQKKAYNDALAQEKQRHVEAMNAAKEQFQASKTQTTEAINSSKLRVQSMREQNALVKEGITAQKLRNQQDQLNIKASTSAAAAQSKSNLQLAQFNTYLKTLKPQALTELASEIQNIRALLHDGMPESLKKATSAISSFKARVKECGYEGGNAFTYLQAKVKTFITYFISSRITMMFVNGFRQMISNVKDLNAALTDLRIVTGASNESAKALLKTYGHMAQDMGATTKDTASAAVEWQRQGYGIADTNTLIADSMILSKVGFIDSAEAATALTAAMKGYQLEVGDAIGVVDKFTAVDMKAATSAGDLATALSKTAANAKLAGLDLNDVIGQLAVVNEVMQEDASSTGTFYNTMLSRMGMIKAGNLKDPETDEDLSDVESTLRGLGISLRASNSEFRNFGEVLDEVGGKWDSFSSVQQRAIATAFAGTRQQTRFLSLMQGWDKAAEYSKTASESAGTAMEKFGIYQESLAAKQQSSAAAFEMFSQKLINSGLVAWLYDAGTVLFNFGAGLPDVVVGIGELTAAVIALSAAGSMMKASGFLGHITKLPRDLG